MIDPDTHYEIQAHAFYSMTGCMAPGKDMPAAMAHVDYNERENAWAQWLREYGHCVRTVIKSYDVVVNNNQGETK